MIKSRVQAQVSSQIYDQAWQDVWRTLGYGAQHQIGGWLWRRVRNQVSDNVRPQVHAKIQRDIEAFGHD